VTEPSIGGFEIHLGRLLNAGVLTSAALLAAGLFLWEATPWHQTGGAILTTGLIVLMATPILRVLVSVIEYWRMRDWFFVVTTLVVLAVLLTSVMTGLAVRAGA
jgi:Protein of unknown function (DUF1634)